MNLNQKNTVTIYIKDNKTKKNQITTQTQNMRDEINQKIRDLGPKYYQIKNIFDRFSFHRDVLFAIGKELESEYQNIKKNIMFQNKNRRMKEAIICWFVQNFYNELMESNSLILNRIIIAQQEYKLYNFNFVNMQLQMNKTKQKPKKSQINTQIPQNKKEIQNDISNKNNFFKDMKVNTEIDGFDSLNNMLDITNNNISTKNNNFIYEYSII